jgi:integrase
MQTLSPEEARRFLATAAGDRLEALYILALTTGMRQGELFRLRWADVDLEGQALAVRGETKTAKSRRQVLLSDVGVEALRRHAGRQAEECRAAGNEWRETGLVFANAVGGSLTYVRKVLSERTDRWPDCLRSQSEAQVGPVDASCGRWPEQHFERVVWSGDAKGVVEVTFEAGPASAG